MTINKYKKPFFGAAVLGLALVAGPQAQAVIIDTDASITDEVPGIAEFKTTGDLMAGMEVTAQFESFSETLSWQDLGGDIGGVSGTDWDFFLSGDSFVTSWLFDNDTDQMLLSLTLDGRPGLTVFDRTFNLLEGTEGSEKGKDFSETPEADGTATYSRIVALEGEAAVGDLWHVLTIDFTTDDRDLPEGIRGDWRFEQDTDNDIRRSVPEPMTLVLAVIGLAGLGLRQRFQQH